MSMDVPEFTSDFRCAIAARGVVFEGEAPCDFARATDWDNRVVRINGVPATVHSIAIGAKIGRADTPPPRKGDRIGVMVATSNPAEWG